MDFDRVHPWYDAFTKEDLEWALDEAKDDLLADKIIMLDYEGHVRLATKDRKLTEVDTVKESFTECTYQVIEAVLYDVKAYINRLHPNQNKPPGIKQKDLLNHIKRGIEARLQEAKNESERGI